MPGDGNGAPAIQDADDQRRDLLPMQGRIHGDRNLAALPVLQHPAQQGRKTRRNHDRGLAGRGCIRTSIQPFAQLWAQR